MVFIPFLYSFFFFCSTSSFLLYVRYHKHKIIQENRISSILSLETCHKQKNPTFARILFGLSCGFVWEDTVISTRAIKVTLRNLAAKKVSIWEATGHRKLKFSSHPRIWEVGVGKERRRISLWGNLITESCICYSSSSLLFPSQWKTPKWLDL